MQTGTKISAIAHVTLIGWALFGGVFRSEPLPFEVQEVSVISAEEFAAMTAPRSSPEVTDGPAAITPPEPEPETFTPEPEPEPAPEPIARPEPTPQPEPETPPESVSELAAEEPEPEVVEQVPTPPEPEPEPEIAALPVPPAIRPEPRPVDRVAPVPVAPPEPDTQPDDVETPAVTAEPGAETEREEQSATAPEEATDQIVTEATETSDSAAPESTIRPRTRPASRPTTAEQTQTVQADEPSSVPDTSAAINDALAEALGGSSNEEQPQAVAPAPTGPPMSAGEKENLRVAVSSCWNVGSLSTEALGTTVVVSVNMARDGTPDQGSIRMIDFSGGSRAAAEQAFQAARRAILRCGAKGYDLPVEKYDHWREIEMTFNPEGMRFR
ncbi:energy transducer TonB [Lutimaribacter marinistellae]|uniref:Energy transducer TonB n=1 Tax=Lutimaribacter marinistellae TaxID=1820329 RepID=A0ABV7TKA6_9RHOB